MDWTIVTSVLVALLLWVLSLAAFVAVTVAVMFTVLRSRSQRMMADMMSACMTHVQSMMAGSQPEGAKPAPHSNPSAQQLTRAAAPCAGSATGKEAEHARR
jgi:hypothetical protein